MNLPFCGSSTCSGFAVSALKFKNFFVNIVRKPNLNNTISLNNLISTYLYNEIFPSCEPEITNLSHGENATVHKSTGPSAAWFNNWPVSVFQIHRPESSELLAINCPSELTATETTPSEWPVNVFRNCKRLSTKSHILTVSSKLPVTIKSLNAGVAVDSFDASGSAFSSVATFFGSLVRPQATLQILSSCANSCWCNSEY